MTVPFHDQMVRAFAAQSLNPTSELVAYTRLLDDTSTSALEGCDAVQSALCGYMDAVVRRHHAFNEILGRTKRPNVADSLTEAVNLAIQAIVRDCASPAAPSSVSSEKLVLLPDKKPSGRRETRQPDICVRQHGLPIIIVECKTSLGWFGGGLSAYYSDMVTDYAKVAIAPHEVFLVVACDALVSGEFVAGRAKYPQWIALSKGWPDAESSPDMRAGMVSGELWRLRCAIVAQVTAARPHVQRRADDMRVVLRGATSHEDGMLIAHIRDLFKGQPDAKTRAEAALHQLCHERRLVPVDKEHRERRYVLARTDPSLDPADSDHDTRARDT